MFPRLFPRQRFGLRSVLRGAVGYLWGRRGKRRLRAIRLFYRVRLLWMLKASTPLRALSRNFEVRMWVDGVKSFARIEQLINRARSTIVIQMFIWKDDEIGRRIAAALLRAARRGVQVHITKEAVGDIFELTGDFLSTREGDNPLWREFWTHPNIAVRHDAEHDHTKAYIIDGEIVLLTGMNIADEYWKTWHDYMVELRGTRFANQILSRAPIDPNGNQSVQVVMNTESQSAIRLVLTKILNEAREHVVIEHCYFSDPQTIEQLFVLMRRGVRVTAIFPSEIDVHFHGNMLTIGQLMARAPRRMLTVMVYPGPFHAKIILVDNNAAFVGSANLTASSLDDMGEVNVVIRRRVILRSIREILHEDILKSRPLTHPPGFLWWSRLLAILGL